MPRAVALVPVAVAFVAAAPLATVHAESVRVAVTFSGKAPTAAVLDRKSDPYCSKTEARNEEVLVTNGKLENVVVRVVKGAKNATTSGDVVIEQLGCMYRPRIAAAQLGQNIVVKNGDRTMHNVHTYVGADTLFNRAQTAGSSPITQAIHKEDLEPYSVIRFKCDVHAWMAAFVVVADNPFFGVTGASGEVKLDGLPPGKYTISTWHERYGEKTASVTVEAGKTAELKFDYTGNEPRPSH